MLQEKFNNDFKVALKDKDAIKVSVLRMLKADIINTEIKLNKKSLADEDIIKIVQQHIKQHNDSIEQFKKGDRVDLAEKEEKELLILKTYVPKQLSDSELEKIVKSVIGELSATSKKDLGLVIKAVLEKSKGTVEGKRASLAAGKLLTG